MKTRYLDHDNRLLKYKRKNHINVEIAEHDPTYAENIESEQDTNDLKLVDEHNVLKRSVCKPHQEFQSECNQCKCAADGHTYTCSHNECMDGEKDKEVEVFMENEVRGRDHTL